MMYTVVAFLCGAIWSYCLQNIYKKTNNIDNLKNALLTLSLFKLRRDDVSDSFDYQNYDGTKLPPLSGADLSMACFSYILDIQEFRNSNMYSGLMETKLRAINKYLDKNFATEQQIVEFFEQVVERVK